MDVLPIYSDVLVKELDKTIPPKCAAKGETLEDIYRYAGKREVVESLLARLKLTEDPDLQGNERKP